MCPLVCKACGEHLSEAAHKQCQGEEEKNIPGAEGEHGLLSAAQCAQAHSLLLELVQQF